MTGDARASPDRSPSRNATTPSRLAAFPRGLKTFDSRMRLQRCGSVCQKPKAVIDILDLPDQGHMVSPGHPRGEAVAEFRVCYKLWQFGRCGSFATACGKKVRRGGTPERWRSSVTSGTRSSHGRTSWARMNGASKAGWSKPVARLDPASVCRPDAGQERFVCRSLNCSNSPPPLGHFS